MSIDQKIVLAAGAFGGLASWAYSILVGTSFGVGMWLALPLCVILGIAAAFIAVYMITPTDLTQTGRLLGYALLCGIMWKPVTDGATVLIQQRMELAKGGTQVKQQASMLTSTPPAQLSAKVNEATDAATKLLHDSSQVSSPELKSDSAKPVADAVNAIAATSSRNPAEAKKALEKIAVTAQQTNHPEVHAMALEKLRVLSLPEQQLTPTGGAPPPSHP